MKKQLLFVILMFGITATATGQVTVSSYETDADSAYNKYVTDSFCKWYTVDNDVSTILDNQLRFTEYDLSGKITKQGVLSITQRFNKDGLVYFDVTDSDGLKYRVIFWTDGIPMVAYEFETTYVLMTGAINYQL